MNKKLIIGGGLALVGAYLLTRGDDDEGSFGGGSGGGLSMLPSLDDAGADPVGDIIYNLGAGGETQNPFSVFGDEKGDTTSKKTAYIAQYGQPESVMAQVFAGETIYGSYKGDIRFGAADVAEDLGGSPKLRFGAADVAEDLSKAKKPSPATSSKSSKSSRSTPWYKPWTWNLSDAGSNYLAYSDSTWDFARKDNTGDRAGVSATKKVSSQAVTTVREASKRRISGSSKSSTSSSSSSSSSSKKKYRDGRGGYTSKPGQPD